MTPDNRAGQGLVKILPDVTLMILFSRDDRPIERRSSPGRMVPSARRCTRGVGTTEHPIPIRRADRI